MILKKLDSASSQSPIPWPYPLSPKRYPQALSPPFRSSSLHQIPAHPFKQFDSNSSIAYASFVLDGNIIGTKAALVYS